jgi:hypothetical protein
VAKRAARDARPSATAATTNQVINACRHLCAP